MNNQYGSLVGLVIFILDVVAIVEIVRSGKDTTSKILWALLILVFPIGGLIIYALFGRSKPLAPIK